MSKIRKSYTKVEKLEIVKLSLEDEVDLGELAARYNIHKGTLYNWRGKYAKNKENSFPGKGNKQMTDEEREIARLNKALREAELERDILKKAINIFSKKN